MVAAALLAACGGGGVFLPAMPVPETLSINVPPSADVDAAVQFGNSAGALGGLSYRWDFGDGETSADPAPKHLYAHPGDYEVVLKVANATGSSRETRTQISVNNLGNVQGLSCSGPRATGWCVQAEPRPGSSFAVSFGDAKHGFMLDRAGNGLQTRDGGLSWHVVGAGFGQPLALQFVSAQTGWMIDAAGRFVGSSDGGASWSRRLGTPYGVNTTEPDDAQYTHLGFDTELRGWYRRLDPFGEIRFVRHAVTLDGGSTWKTVEFPLPHDAVQMRLGSRAWVAISSAEALLVSTDGGRNWVQSPGIAKLSAAAFSDAQTLWVLSDGRMLKSLDLGTSWKDATPSTVSARLNDIVFSSAKVGWAVGDGGVVLSTQDGGVSWSRQVSGVGYALEKIQSTDVKTAWITNREGLILATGSGGL